MFGGMASGIYLSGGAMHQMFSLLDKLFYLILKHALFVINLLVNFYLDFKILILFFCSGFLPGLLHAHLILYPKGPV
jgi:hypothetical protein